MDTPAKCALCGGNHPANYKGCEHYHNIIKGNNPHRNQPEKSIPPLITTHAHTTSLPCPPQQQCSYGEVARNDAQRAEEPLRAIKVFLEDFKGLFAQILHQNSVIINMLSTLLNNRPH